METLQIESITRRILRDLTTTFQQMDTENKQKIEEGDEMIRTLKKKVDGLIMVTDTLRKSVDEIPALTTQFKGLEVTLDGKFRQAQQQDAHLADMMQQQKKQLDYRIDGLTLLEDKI